MAQMAIQKIRDAGNAVKACLIPQGDNSLKIDRDKAGENMSKILETLKKLKEGEFSWMTDQILANLNDTIESVENDAVDVEDKVRKVLSFLSVTWSIIKKNR